MNFKKYISEFIGTYALVFFGTGAVVINDVSNGAITHLGISICFGLVVMAMIYAFGSTSGAHINPAVTIAFWLSGRFSGRLVIPYILSQFIGGILASTTLFIMFPDHMNFGSTIPSGSFEQSFILEMMLTFFLIYVIMQVSIGSMPVKALAGIIIGFTVLLCALFGGPISGASMNPARTLGPAIVSGNFTGIFIYMIAPIMGSSLAILCCRTVCDENCCSMPVRDHQG